MPVDTSIYSQVAPPPDPFAIPNKLIGLRQGMIGAQNAQIENSLLQRRLEGDQAYQNALSQPGAVSDNGELSVPLVRNGLVGTPAAAMIPDVVHANQGNVGENIKNEGSRYDLNDKQFARVGEAVGAGMQANPKFGVKDALSVVNGLVHRQIISPQQGGSIQTDLPRDPVKAKMWMAQTFLRTLPNAGANGSVTGGIASDGSTISVTPGQFVTQSLGVDDGTSNAPKPTPGPAPGGPAPIPVTVQPKPRVGVVTSLPPGATDAANQTALASANQANTLMKAAEAAPDSRAKLDQMKSYLDYIITGPGASEWNRVKAASNVGLDLMNLPPSIRFNSDIIAKSENFKKIAAQLAQTQQQVLGGTDAGLASGQAANPEFDKSTEGNRRAVNYYAGQQDATEAKAQAWQQALASGTRPEQYQQWVTNFNKTFSPRAFQWARMTPEEQASEYKGMSLKDKEALQKAQIASVRNGWISLPSAVK